MNMCSKNMIKILKKIITPLYGLELAQKDVMGYHIIDNDSIEIVDTFVSGSRN